MDPLERTLEVYELAGTAGPGFTRSRVRELPFEAVELDRAVLWAW